MKYDIKPIAVNRAIAIILECRGVMVNDEMIQNIDRSVTAARCQRGMPTGRFVVRGLDAIKEGVPFDSDCLIINDFVDYEEIVFRLEMEKIKNRSSYGVVLTCMIESEFDCKLTSKDDLQNYKRFIVDNAIISEEE